jgi:hypothetical protein
MALIFKRQVRIEMTFDFDDDESGLAQDTIKALCTKIRAFNDPGWFFDHRDVKANGNYKVHIWLHAEKAESFSSKTLETKLKTAIETGALPEPLPDSVRVISVLKSYVEPVVEE